MPRMERVRDAYLAGDRTHTACSRRLSIRRRSSRPCAFVERWLLGRLRHRTFFSLADVNAAIADLMTHLNEERQIRRLGVTRRQLLEQMDRPALKSLPTEPYEFSE